MKNLTWQMVRDMFQQTTKELPETLKSPDGESIFDNLLSQFADHFQIVEGWTDGQKQQFITLCQNFFQ